MRYLFLILIVLISTCAAFAQKAIDPPGVGVDSIYLAKDDGTGKAGDPVTTFYPGDIPIYCVVQLDSSTPVTVKMNLVAQNVKGVKADSKVVSVSYTTKDGQNRVNFTGKPAGKWVMGTYRVDIFLDNKLAKNVSFEIKEPAAAGVESATLFQPGAASKPVDPRKRN